MRSLWGDAPADGRPPSTAMRAANGRAYCRPLPNPPRANLSGWIASRNVAPASRPMPHGMGAGLPLASPLREVRVGLRTRTVGKPVGADTNRVCPRQTASDLSPISRPPQGWGDLGADHWQAHVPQRAVRLASGGLSFPLQPQSERRDSWARASGEKMVAQLSDGSWNTDVPKPPAFAQQGGRNPPRST